MASAMLGLACSSRLVEDLLSEHRVLRDAHHPRGLRPATTSPAAAATRSGVTGQPVPSSVLLIRRTWLCFLPAQRQFFFQPHDTGTQANSRPHGRAFTLGGSPIGGNRREQVPFVFDRLVVRPGWAYHYPTTVPRADCIGRRSIGPSAAMIARSRASSSSSRHSRSTVTASAGSTRESVQTARHTARPASRQDRPEGRGSHAATHDHCLTQEGAREGSCGHAHRPPEPPPLENAQRWARKLDWARV